MEPKKNTRYKTRIQLILLLKKIKRHMNQQHDFVLLITKKIEDIEQRKYVHFVWTYFLVVPSSRTNNQI